MTDGADRVLLGYIGGLYGVHGWLRVHSYTQPAEKILAYKRWRLEPGGEMRVLTGRRHGAGLVASLAQARAVTALDSRDGAATLVGARIMVARAQLPPPEPGQVYWADLMGCDVRSESGFSLGVVTDVRDTGAHPLLAVRGDRERLIPLVRGPIVRAIDLEAGVITVDWEPDF